MRRDGVSDEVGGVNNRKVLAFGGVEVLLPILGPAGAANKRVFESLREAVSGGYVFNVIMT